MNIVWKYQDSSTQQRKDFKLTVKEMKYGKAPGSNKILLKLLNKDKDMVADLLYHMFEKVWNQEEIPYECLNVL